MRRNSYLIITSFFLLFFCVYELMQGFHSFRSESLHKAKDVVSVMLAVRKWNSDVCDLYASAKHVSPNPYLNDKNRDIVSGNLELTKINPSYMTRMTSEILADTSSINVRMISSKPLNPDNMPRGWETSALKSIGKGRTEFSGIDYSDLNNIMFHYIKPVYVEKNCLHCHMEQGYKLGSLRGGISVSFKVTKAHNRIFFSTIIKILAYLLSAALVITIIINSRRKLLKAYEEKLKTIAELEKEIARREMSEAALVTQTRSSSANEVLSLISHHWRQPLNNVGLLVQAIKEEDDKKQIETYSDSAFAIVKDMSETIDLFTSSVRLTKPEKLDIKNMVFDVLKLLKPELESSSIEAYLYCTIGGDKSAPVSTDTAQIFHSCGLGNLKCEKICGLDGVFIMGEESIFKQILFILLKNSYDALLETPKGDRQIKITFEKNDCTVLISVCDNGAPISEETKARLFEPYFTTKGVKAGRGIGLFSARSLVSNFEDAQLYYDDTNGKCFVFKFKTC